MNSSNLIQIVLSISIFFCAPAKANWFSSSPEDKIEVEIQNVKIAVENGVNWGTFIVHIQNDSDKILDVFLKVKVFDESNVFLNEGTVQILKLGPGKDGSGPAYFQNFDVSKVKSWKFELTFPSGAWTKDGNQITDFLLHYDTFKIVDQSKSRLPIETAGSSGDSSNTHGWFDWFGSKKSESASASAPPTVEPSYVCKSHEKAADNFVRSCSLTLEMGTRTRMQGSQIEQHKAFCMCVADHFSVESTADENCEYRQMILESSLQVPRYTAKCGSS